MSQFQNDPTGQTEILNRLLRLIEDIRYSRYEKWRGNVHPLQRKFTQFELTQLALPTYGNLLGGRSNRLPARQQILDIASYLECTISETNSLLHCAQYLPEYEPLTASEYSSAVARAVALGKSTLSPTIIIGIGGKCIASNNAFSKVKDIDPISSWNPKQRDIIHALFDTQSNSHELCRYDDDTWLKTARDTVELLKSVTKHIRNEPWFVEQIKQWCKLPIFGDFWDTSDPISDPFSVNVYSKMHTSLIREPITEVATLIPFSKNFEVCLVVWQPLDEASRHVYRILGFDHEGLETKTD